MNAVDAIQLDAPYEMKEEVEDQMTHSLQTLLCLYSSFVVFVIYNLHRKYAVQIAVFVVQPFLLLVI